MASVKSGALSVDDIMSDPLTAVAGQHWAPVRYKTRR